MSGLFIRITQAEIDGKQKVKITIDNCRGDNSTANERTLCDKLEPLIQSIIEENVKNPVITDKTKWED